MCFHAGKESKGAKNEATGDSKTDAGGSSDVTKTEEAVTTDETAKPKSSCRLGGLPKVDNDSDEDDGGEEKGGGEAGGSLSDPDFVDESASASAATKSASAAEKQRKKEAAAAAKAHAALMKELSTNVRLQYV